MEKQFIEIKIDGKRSIITRGLIIDECKLCLRHDGTYCVSYQFPEAKWRAGECPRFVTEQLKVRGRKVVVMKPTRWKKLKGKE